MPFAAIIFQARASVRSPSLATSSIFLPTFVSKVSLGVESVVISSSFVNVRRRLAYLPLEVVERLRDAALLLLPVAVRCRCQPGQTLPARLRACLSVAISTSACLRASSAFVAARVWSRSTAASQSRSSASTACANDVASAAVSEASRSSAIVMSISSCRNFSSTASARSRTAARADASCSRSMSNLSADALASQPCRC